MDCLRIRALLSQYIDDALDAPTKKTVQDHLAFCKACQAELTSLKTLVGELRSLEQIKAPDDFLEGVHKRISPAPRPKGLLKRLFFPLRIKIPLELAAAVAVAAMVVLVFNVQRDVTISEYRHSTGEPPQKGVETQPGSLSPPRQVPLEVSLDEALKEEGPIEVVLLLDTKMSRRSYPQEGHARMKLSQREIQKHHEKKGDYGASSRDDELRIQKPAVGVTPEQPEAQKIRDLISRMDGSILEEAFDNASGRLTSILASLPAGRLPSFFKEISQLASIKESTPRPDLEKDQNVHIRIVFSSNN
jgi:hypothetical protein